MAKISELLRKSNHHFCTVVVVAAGSSRRMGQDKLMMDLGGKPVIIQTLLALDKCAAVDEIIPVTAADKVESLAALCREHMLRKVTKVVIGGATRTESALAGVTEADRRAEILCIHDGARPFVTSDVICDAIHNAVLYHAACPAVGVKDTIRVASGGVAVSTPARSDTYAMQTPQAFQADLIKGALTAAVAAGASYTDDCAAVEALGVKIHLSLGDEDNIKLTTPNDLALARLILDKRRGAPVCE
ncbi:MAG: 2-C-methyl-D-erythritol 4-phosphate cytidylyltransferase [Oscillospiraceae bacterium]